MTYKPTNTGTRSVPEAGELWEFSNGIIATIMKPEPRSGTDRPEIAQTDPTDGKTAFKFNDDRDPMPVRRVNI